MDRAPDVPLRPARRLRPRSLYLVLVQGPSGHPGAALGPLRPEQADRRGRRLMLGLTPSGRRVVVTGATGGIGRALAETLQACDCAVAACDVPGAPVGDVTAVTATFDVRDPEAVRRGVADAIESLGGCDAGIANGGIVATIHRPERFSDEGRRKEIELKLK